MAALLRNIYLFKELDQSELQKVSDIARDKTYTAGQDIFVKGNVADAMYVIKMGTVGITATSGEGDEMKIATLATGAYFGEMPLLDNEKRSASAKAIENTTLSEVRYDELKSLMAANDKIAAKIYRALATYLAGRLRVTTEDLNYSREQNLRHF